MHQGCNIFRPYNGVQCTAIALIALIVFMQRMPHISNLSSEELDFILRDGTDLHTFKITVGPGDICITEIYLMICRTGIVIMVKLNIFMTDIMGQLVHNMQLTGVQGKCISAMQFYKHWTYHLSILLHFVIVL